jgi:hypothetical protein
MSKAEDLDAREYFFATIRWFDQWPICAIEQFEQAGFKNIRLEHVEPHPVWQLRMKCPGNNLSSTQAGRVVRTVVERRGKILRDGFYCSIDRRGIVQAGFVLEL